MPSDGKFLASWHRNIVIAHPPIETTNLKEKDVESLKEKVFQIIKKDLEKYNPHIRIPKQEEKQ